MSRKTNLVLSKALLIMGLVSIAIAIILQAQPILAQDESESEEQDEVILPTNDYCLLCHANTDQVWHLPSGETLSLEIDPEVLAASVHGTANTEGALQCADCHGDFRFPHPVPLSQNLREFRLERYTTCRNCHEDQYTHSQDGVHGTVLRSGREDAAVCVDCHGGHDIQTPGKSKASIAVTCGRCHGAIFEQYRTSVHGAALLNEQNQDVPTCIDCHGIHDIQNPTTALFRERSPELCAKCHADSELMSKYDISSDVFDSYLSDFHGATVALFEQKSPGVVTNKAVCYDCHGVHNIQAVGDGEDGLVSIRSSLIKTCRECHPDASENFSDAWIGHYPATLDKNTGLYIVGVLYNVLIPLIIGFAVLFVGSAVIRRIRQRWINIPGEEEE